MNFPSLPCSSLHFAVPSLCSPLASVPQQPCEDREGEGHTAQHLARFLRGALYLAVSALAQLEVQRSYEDFQLVPVLATNILLLWQTLMQGDECVSLAREYGSPASWVWSLDVLTPPFVRPLPQPRSCLRLPSSTPSPHTGTPVPGILPPPPHPPLP